MAKTPHPGRILILDDDIRVTKTLELIFIARGYKVRVAYSAEEAVGIIAGWQPDVALVDVMLPIMNGIEFGCLLNENYPDTQVILVSGHPDSGQLLETAKKRGHSFALLAKPVHPGHILEIVAGLLPACCRV